MELLVLLLLFVINGTFSMSEMAVVSSRKARLQQWADERRAGAQVALALANEPTNFLATIQVGITVIGITSGAFGEATIAHEVAKWIAQWPAAAAYAETLAIVLVVAGITLASLIVGELVPKRLALLNPEAIASVIARPMRMLSTVAYPIVRALGFTTDGILKLLGLEKGAGPPVTEEEIKVLMEQGTVAGIFEPHERALVTRVFRLDELRVTGVMTPRSEVLYLDLDDSDEENMRRIREGGHSRFPVVHGDLEHVEGIVFVKTLVDDVLAGRTVDLRAHLAKPLFVPQTLTVMEVVAAFKQRRQTLALVVNEFGVVQGIVTLNDVMEALVGDIATVEGAEERDIIEREDGTWLVDGGVTIERFKDVLEIDETLPEEDAGTYHTLAGFVMLQLERVPETGDTFNWNGLRIEVVDMDRNRVDKVIVGRMSVDSDGE